MTNSEIIYKNSEVLMKQGVLNAESFMRVKDQDGNDVLIPVPEAIHTFSGWKEMGYSVKNGEHAIAKFAIWKHIGKKKDSEGNEVETINGGMILKSAFWFKFSQVEPMKERA